MAFCGRSPESVARAAEEMAQNPGGTVFGEAVDVSKPEQVERFFKGLDRRFSHLHILVNNAGVGIFRKVKEMTVEDWQKTLDVNLSGAFYCCRETLQRLNNAEGGYIINISSLAGKNPFSGGAAYNASKFGLNGFSEALMLDHRYDNVRVSYIMPGSVNTEFGSRSEPSDWMIAPEDVAQVVMNLLEMPERTLVSRVEMRPLKPRK